MRELCRLYSSDRASPKMFHVRHLEARRRKSPFVRRMSRDEEALTGACPAGEFCNRAMTVPQVVFQDRVRRRFCGQPTAFRGAAGPGTTLEYPQLSQVTWRTGGETD